MGGADSATDGDMDIAYSLLLADKQWGSDGTINYLSEATNMINALMQSDVNQSQWTLRLGDWATSGTSQGFAYATSTRPSDFMFDHMQSYYEATGDGRWTNVMAHTYAVVNTLFNNNSPNTGLIPDFVVLNGSTYQPAPANFLEAATDGEYNYNSCRTPWRFATDYLLRNTSSILTEMRKMNSWIQSSSGGNANNVYPGYNLGGGALNNTYTDDSFTSPFGLCAMIDSGDQTWLNTVWTWIAARGINVNDGYFGNSITMQCAIVLSGNWWKPVYAASSSPDFTITETPASQTVTAGNATNYTVNIGTVNGFTGTVGLSAAGLPAGATAAFNPTSNTPTGSKTLTVIGTSGTLVHSNTVTLTVNAIGGGGGSTNNLALNQTASASTTWSASYAASYAVDGNPSTRWSAASGQTNNQWLLVDFGTATAYSSVVIKEISFQRVTAFKIQSSTDGTTFTDLATGTTIGTNLTVTFSTVSARYVRLFVTSASNVPTINEFEVYGSGSGGGAVAAPTFSPAGGTYTSAQSVTISTTTGGASIRYTTDGSTPN
jgi:hypothetical protein